MADTASATDDSDIELLASIDGCLLRLSGREGETLYRHVNAENRRAWQEVEVLIERRTVRGRTLRLTGPAISAGRRFTSRSPPLRIATESWRPEIALQSS